MARVIGDSLAVGRIWFRDVPVHFGLPTRKKQHSSAALPQLLGSPSTESDDSIHSPLLLLIFQRVTHFRPLLREALSLATGDVTSIDWRSCTSAITSLACDVVQNV